jgi:hypothetical protein
MAPSVGRNADAARKNACATFFLQTTLSRSKIPRALSRWPFSEIGSTTMQGSRIARPHLLASRLFVVYHHRFGSIAEP